VPRRSCVRVPVWCRRVHRTCARFGRLRSLRSAVYRDRPCGLRQADRIRPSSFGALDGCGDGHVHEHVLFRTGQRAVGLGRHVGCSGWSTRALANIGGAYDPRAWKVRLHPEVEAWFLELCRTDPASAGLVAEAIDLLAEQGPGAMGRPLVDRLKGSTFHHMKELRPGSAGSSEIRISSRLTRSGRRSSW
jgi:hypothetical protein